LKGRLIRFLIGLSPLQAFLKDLSVFLLLAGDYGLISQAFYDATLGLVGDLHLNSLLSKVFTEMHRQVDFFFGNYDFISTWEQFKNL